MSKELNRDSWSFIVRGILAIGLGILTFVSPAPTLAALILVFGIYAILDGGLAVVVGLEASSRPNWWLVAGGVAATAIGIFTFFQPGTTAVALVVLVGIFAIVTGVAELVAAATPGDLPHRGLLVLSGAVGVAFGMFLILSPGAGILSVLGLIGFYAIFAGAMDIAMGFSLRDISNTVKSVEPRSSTAGS